MMDINTAREDMACAFRWTARLDMHEAVANHFSLAINERELLINPNQRHFSLIKASELLQLDMHQPLDNSDPDAPDPTAWGLHAPIHRKVPRATCMMHVHSTYATVLASLADSRLPPVDQNAATFFNRVAVDENFGGLAFEDEGERIGNVLNQTNANVMLLGNHGLLVLGRSVADAFNRMYYFERAAENYVKALWTQQPLRLIPDDIAEKTAQELESYPGQAERHFSSLKEILHKEASDFAA